MTIRSGLMLAAIALLPGSAGAQILNGVPAPNQSVGPGIEARSGVPSIVGDPKVSLPRPTTLRRDDAASDTRCDEDGTGRVAVRTAIGETQCVDRGRVGRLR